MTPRRCFCGHREDEHYKKLPGAGLCRRCERCDGFATLSKPDLAEDKTLKPLNQKMAGIEQTKEAMSLLERHRGPLLTKARALAKNIINKEGSVHSRRIRKEMLSDIEEAGVSDHWLSAVFNHPDFEWTGEWHNDQSLNVHARPVRVWRLKA